MKLYYTFDFTVLLLCSDLNPVTFPQTKKEKQTYKKKKRASWVLKDGWGSATPPNHPVILSKL